MLNDGEGVNGVLNKTKKTVLDSLGNEIKER